MYLCPAVRLANLILVFLEDLSGDGLFDILRDGAGSARSCRSCPHRLFWIYTEMLTWYRMMVGFCAWST